MAQANSPAFLQVFYCYARKDKPLQEQLALHLEPLRRLGRIVTWQDCEIQPGNEWNTEIDIHLEVSDIILLLISPNFISSDYCYSIEMQKSIERYREGKTCIIPIILRPVHWQETPIGQFQALPAKGKPITRWRNRDEAFYDVVKGISEVVDILAKKKLSKNYAQEIEEKLHAQMLEYKEWFLRSQQALQDREIRLNRERKIEATEKYLTQPYEEHLHNQEFWLESERARKITEEYRVIQTNKQYDEIEEVQPNEKTQRNNYLPQTRYEIIEKAMEKSTGRRPNSFSDIQKDKDQIMILCRRCGSSNIKGYHFCTNCKAIL